MAAEEERGLTQRLIKNSANVHKKSNALLMAKVCGACETLNVSRLP